MVALSTWTRVGTVVRTGPAIVVTPGRLMLRAMRVSPKHTSDASDWSATVIAQAPRIMTGRVMSVLEIAERSMVLYWRDPATMPRDVSLTRGKAGVLKSASLVFQNSSDEASSPLAR